ncbi:MAG: YdcF family protein [Clostridia bacterium]|nr:YdcF family protein [Clostridia bacterium]
MKNSGTVKRIFKTAAAVILSAVLLFAAFVGVCNAIVLIGAKDHVISADEAQKEGGFDCILILGCKVYSDGTLSPMLKRRVDAGAELYFKGVSDKILVTGDSGHSDYDEPTAMKEELVRLGVPEDDVVVDYAGFSTYDSVYRAKEVFCAQKILIVTQEFHISRAVWIARILGSDAKGVASDTGSGFLDGLRETGARAGYMYYAVFKPEPEISGEKIPIQGQGIS